jgi:hypothetical protein
VGSAHRRNNISRRLWHGSPRSSCWGGRRKCLVTFIPGTDAYNKVQTYDKTVIPRLVATLREFFELNAALQVLISATIRNEETFETFLNTCSGSSSGCCETAALRHGRCVANICGVERNDFSCVRVDFPAVPENHQVGPFFPTTTPIQIWSVTKAQPGKDPFAF